MTPTAVDERLVADEKFERPTDTEFVDPAVQTLAYPNADEFIAAAVFELPTAVDNSALAVLVSPPTAVESVPDASCLNPHARDLSPRASLPTPTAVELIPMTAAAACGAP
jgi:hypothetical protein